MKKVVITGGNKGIGLAITKKFLSSDFEVVIIARNFSNFTLNDKNIHKVVFDLTQTDKISSLVEQIGEIDVLINDAGVINSLPFDNYPEDKKQYLMKLNLVAPVILITQFSKSMIQKKSGRIVNVASIAGEIGHPDIWYGISKAGIINITKSFAKILGPKGIVVNCVAPGPVEGTAMFSVIPESRKQQLIKSTISQRFAKPEEIANVVYWLSTDAPAHINGVCIDVNNGSFPR